MTVVYSIDYVLRPLIVMSLKTNVLIIGWPEFLFALQEYLTCFNELATYGLLWFYYYPVPVTTYYACYNTFIYRTIWTTLSYHYWTLFVYAYDFLKSLVENVVVFHAVARFRTFRCNPVEDPIEQIKWKYIHTFGSNLCSNLFTATIKSPLNTTIGNRKHYEWPPTAFIRENESPTFSTSWTKIKAKRKPSTKTRCWRYYLNNRFSSSDRNRRRVP